MIIPMLCVTIFVILVVWFLLPRVARLMIHTPTAISIFVCLSMVQLMAVFISMRCTLCGHFLQVALTLILVVGYAIRSEERFSRNAETDLVCRLLLEKKKTVSRALRTDSGRGSFMGVSVEIQAGEVFSFFAMQAIHSSKTLIQYGYHVTKSAQNANLR